MRVSLEPHPSSLAGRPHQSYRPWLLRQFFDHLCAYCLLQHDELEVEHYEPHDYAENRANDPSNLLLACGRCNGPGGKGDYHPNHTTRRRLPHDTTGYLVFDIRCEDFAGLIEVKRDGSVAAKPGPSKDRAAWNIALLKLDLPVCADRRKELLDMLDLCARALHEIDSADEGQREHIARSLDVLLPVLARRWLFFEAHDLLPSEALGTQLQRVREPLLPP